MRSRGIPSKKVVFMDEQTLEQEWRHKSSEVVSVVALVCDEFLKSDMLCDRAIGVFDKCIWLHAAPLAELAKTVSRSGECPLDA